MCTEEQRPQEHAGVSEYVGACDLQGSVLADTLPKGDWHSGRPCSHLNDVVFSIFAVDSFDSADIKTSKHFCTGICPESVPGESTRA